MHKMKGGPGRLLGAALQTHVRQQVEPRRGRACSRVKWHRLQQPWGSALWSTGCKSTVGAPTSPTMEFTDGLFRHLFLVGTVPPLLISDSQLSLYLSLWAKTCKTRHQNPNRKPFQVVLLKMSTVLLDYLLQQMLRMAERNNRPSTQDFNTTTELSKDHMELL